MKPSCARFAKRILGLVAAPLGLFITVSSGDLPQAGAQAPQSGFSVQTPPQIVTPAPAPAQSGAPAANPAQPSTQTPAQGAVPAQSGAPVANPAQQSAQAPVSGLPLPLSNIGQPQPGASPNSPLPLLAPAPGLPPSLGPSEVQAYSPATTRRPELTFKTSEGDFKVRFNRQWAPRNVENVIQLALGTKEFTDIRTGKKAKRPFYTGLNCHRVIKGFLIQCGCPFGNGRGGPGYVEKDEISYFVKIDRPGLVVMAPQVEDTATGRKHVKGSNGSQFFISLAPMPELDGQATIVGEISSGMDTIKKIASTPTGPTDRPIRKVIIFSVDPDAESPVEMPGPGVDPFKN